MFRHEDVSDQTIAERVRAKVGRYVSHPGSVEVSVEQGCVVLRGPILAREIDDLLSAAGLVRGVKEVQNRLEVHEEASDVSGLQGGVARPGERFELMQENWSPASRLFVGMVGCGLLLHGLQRRAPVACTIGTIGLGLLGRSLSNVKTGRMLGLRGRRGIDFQKTIHIARPVEQVFALWRDLENLPRFMANVREVRPLGDGRYHWKVAGPAGTPVEWNAEITQSVPNQKIAWKTEAGSPIAHAGTVRFEPNPDGSRG